MFCLNKCLCTTCVPGTLRVQKRASHSPNFKLRSLSDRGAGNSTQASPRGRSSLNLLDITLASGTGSFKLQLPYTAHVCVHFSNTDYCQCALLKHTAALASVEKGPAVLAFHLGQSSPQVQYVRRWPPSMMFII